MFFEKEKEKALPGVAQWIECRPGNQWVGGSIPSKRTCLGCGIGSQLGVRERQAHIDVCLPLLPFPFLKK